MVDKVVDIESKYEKKDDIMTIASFTECINVVSSRNWPDIAQCYNTMELMK